MGWFVCFLFFFLCVDPPPVPKALTQDVLGRPCLGEAASQGVFYLVVSHEATSHTWVRSPLSYSGLFVDQLLLCNLCAAAGPFSGTPAQNYKGKIWPLESNGYFLSER